MRPCVPTLILLLALSGCESSPPPPVYVTVAGHIEHRPIYAVCRAYPGYREQLLAFAAALEPAGAAFNLQIEYKFFRGAADCETDDMRAETGGRNVIDYLATQHGFEIDPHQEGGIEQGADNYADIRQLAEQVTPLVSEVVGGLLWDDPPQFARLAGGEAGWLVPDFVWEPEILSLAVSSDHHTGDFSRDDVASGVWKPAGPNEAFWEHDESARMVYVGPGIHENWSRVDDRVSSVEFVQELVDGLADGTLDRTGMYTATVTVPQSTIFKAENHAALLAITDELQPMVDAGQVVYVTYTEAVEIWRTTYDEEPNIHHRPE